MTARIPRMFPFLATGASSRSWATRCRRETPTTNDDAEDEDGDAEPDEDEPAVIREPDE